MNTLFPSTIIEGNKLDLSIFNSTSLNIFKGRLLQFVKSIKNSVYTSHNRIGIKYLTRLRLRSSYLCYQKFKHGLVDAINPPCSHSTVIENTIHYFLHCPQSFNCTKYLSQWNYYYYYYYYYHCYFNYDFYLSFLL